jgi:hypothetical protein
MQIFFLHWNPKKIAEYLCDKHIVKLPTETGQILSSVLFMNDVRYQYYAQCGYVMKPVRNLRHPVIQWVRQSRSNYWWTVALLKELCLEFERRYGQKHKLWLLYENIESKRIAEPDLPDIGFVPMSEEYQAVGQTYKHKNPIVAYRMYYIKEKSGIAVWNKNRTPPEWFTQTVCEEQQSLYHHL